MSDKQETQPVPCPHCQNKPHKYWIFEPCKYDAVLPPVIIVKLNGIDWGHLLKIDKK